MVFLFQFFLMSPPDGGGQQNPLSFFLFIGAIFAVMYFFMIRPQTKKAKEQKDFIANLSKGDKVVTIGGIHGKILKVDEDSFLIEVDSNTKLRIDQSVISLEMTRAAYYEKKEGKKDEEKKD